MTSTLWMATGGLSALADAVPPSCRRGADAPAAVVVGHDETVLDSPAWAAAGATHFLPSFCALTAQPFSVRLELSVRISGAWSPWVAGAGLGMASFPPAPSRGGLDVDVDVFSASAGVEAVRLRARVRGPALGAVLEAPWALTLSAAAPRAVPSEDPTAASPGVRLAVPPRSQVESGGAIGARVCSPTSVAMVLDFWGRGVSLETLAAEMFHPATDLYGVWPAAILAAGRHGVPGYLLRFPDWTAARWCLARGLPLIASVRSGAGELTGAAVTETPGHLVVLTGWEGDEVLVNDPAAPVAGGVPRRYRRDELTRVWLERNGVGYVLAPPGSG
jgi:hypothetical protein